MAEDEALLVLSACLASSPISLDSPGLVVRLPAILSGGLDGSSRIDGGREEFGREEMDVTLPTSSLPAVAASLGLDMNACREYCPEMGTGPPMELTRPRGLARIWSNVEAGIPEGMLDVLPGVGG